MKKFDSFLNENEKQEYTDLTEFLNNIFSDGMSKTELEEAHKMGLIDKYFKDVSDAYEFIHKVNWSRYEDVIDLCKKYNISIIQHNTFVDTDMDHGAWTNEYIIKVGENYYSWNYHKYGQGDFDDETTSYEKVLQVFPKEKTITVYE